MTLKEAYQNGVEQLTQAGVGEASLDAWYLLEHVTGISRAMFLADGGRTLVEEDWNQYKQVLDLRAQRIPLQHITGVQEFMGLEFHVNEHVLIPRQDTEVLVETALEAMKGKEQVQVLDMCTGSGCILLSTLYYGRRERTMTGVGVDISPEALQVAMANGKSLEIEATFLESDLFSKVEGTFDMIVSNPPYIPSAVIEGLEPEVKEHDPMLALDGKEDGLYFYRKIIEEAGSHLQPGGCLIFEIGHDQGEAVSSYMKMHGFRDVQVKKDLAGLDRVVYGVYDTCEGLIEE